MKVSEVVDILISGKGINTDEIKITFKEGINVRKLAEIIEKNTNNKKEEVISLMSDKNYLDELITKYWFLKDDILNNEIYYSLEGYLYPDTYIFSSKDVSVRAIFKEITGE